METPTLNDAQRRARFAAEIWPHGAYVLRMARLLTGHAPAAEDLAQETLLRAWRGLEQLAPGTRPQAWLLTILRHVQVDELRRAGRRIDAGALEDANAVPARAADEPSADEDEPAARWRDPQALLARLEDDAMITALQTLPAEMRWTLLLVDVEELDHAQAAAVLGVAVGTVKSRASRGRQLLRHALHQVAKQRGWLADAPQDSSRNAESHP